MGIFRKLFGKKPKEEGDTRGIYLHVACDNCQTVLRIRADKQYDINREENGFSWRKTIVCDKCFRQMKTEVLFDSRYNITHHEIDKGRYVDASQFESASPINTTNEP